jgi:Flp pilus assembly protein TadD
MLKVRRERSDTLAMSLDASLQNVANLVAARRSGEALHAARAAAQDHQGSGVVHRVWAWVALSCGCVDEAHGAAATAARLDPADASAWRLLGASLLDAGQPAPATEALRRSVGLDPSVPASWDLWVTALRRQRRYDEAQAALQSQVARHPGHAPAWAQQAVLCHELRDQVGAERAVARALAVDPEQPQARALRATLQVERQDRAGARETLRGLLSGELPTGVRVSAGLELARLLDLDGDAEAAWAQMERIQELRRASPVFTGCDAGRWPDLLARVARWCQAKTEALPVLYPEPPAFLVGFPRSGTTLVEQMLDAHPDLVTLDELPILERLVASVPNLLGRPFQYPEDLGSLTLEERARLIEAWVRAVAKVRSRPGRVLDKLPLNVAYVPLARALFPDAPFLFAVRDPRDCVTSALFQDLMPNAAMVHLAEVGSAARFYDAVLTAWWAARDLPGLRFREQRYEDLIVDTEGVARGMFEFLGHTFDPACLSWYQRSARKTISTPSVAAVSRPMSSVARGRWRRHAVHLAEVQPVLARWVERFGYEPG